MVRTKNLLSNLWWSGVLTICLWGVAFKANGETANQKVEAQAPAGISATGYIDLRPSWITKFGNFTTEDTVELGAKLTADTSLTYMQGILTNIYDPNSPEAASGMKPQLDAGAIKTKVNNIWKSDSDGLALSYENRVYLPVDEASQSRGMITAIRNYIKLSKSVTDNLKFTLSEIAIPMIHNQSGIVSSVGGASANKVFENRVYFIADLQLTQKLSLSMPLMFHQSRTANFRSDAANNASWSFHVWTSPELDYAVNDNLTLGLAYYNNDSFFTPNLSKAQFGQALESGEFQFVLTASL
jgi:hypothetical protein